jgi:hypothetical protein
MKVMVRSFHIQKWPLGNGKGRDVGESNQGDGCEERGPKKKRKTQEETERQFSLDNILLDRMFGMRIEDCRESRGGEVRLA